MCVLFACKFACVYLCVPVCAHKSVHVCILMHVCILVCVCVFQPRKKDFSAVTENVVGVVEFLSQKQERC